MTREELAKVVAKKANLKVKQADALISAFGDTIYEALDKGEKIVYSNFGTFYTVHYPSKIIIHPKLGEKKKMIMLPTDVVKWMPSNNIKEMVMLGKELPTATTFGTSKQLKEIKKSEGIIHAKSEEITEKPLKEDEEVFDIPIKLFTKKDKVVNDNFEEISKIDDNMSTAASTIDEGAFPDEETAIPIKFKNENEPVLDQSKLAPLQNPAPVSAIAKETSESVADSTEIDLEPAQKAPIEFIDLTARYIPENVLGTIPELFARHFKVVPLACDDTAMTIAMTDPEDIETIDLIRRMARKDITVKITDEDGLEYAFGQYKRLLREQKDTWQDTFENSKRLVKSNKTAPILRIAASIIRKAIREQASEIHLEPVDEEIQIRFRVDGTLIKNSAFPKEIGLTLLDVVKDLGGLDRSIKELPQDGQLRFKLLGTEYDYLVHTIPTAGGEKIFLKLADKLPRLYQLEEIGFDEEDYQKIKQGLSHQSGLILVSGPENAGKTTTAYALIKSLLADVINIASIEDPIEFKLSGVNQSQVKADIGFDLIKGLETISKLDADVIFVGQIDNKKAAEKVFEIACRKLVISTIEATGLADTIKLLAKWEIDPIAINQVINLIIDQKLVRRCCESCKAQIQPDDTESRLIKEVIESLPNIDKEFIRRLSKVHFYKGEGCPDCGNTGYKGRFPVFEVVEMSSDLQEIAIGADNCETIKACLKSHNTKTIAQDGLIKAIMGYTTLSEIWKIKN